MPSKQISPRGFTVIELLVAVGVTALLVSLMLTIVVNVMSGWNRSSGVLTTGNQARLAMDQISKDLQSAIIKRDGNVWLMATVQESGPSVTVAGVGTAQWSNVKPKTVAADASDSSGSIYLPPLPTSATPPPSLEDYRFGQGGLWLRMITSVSDNGGAGSLARISAPRAVSYQIVRTPLVSNGAEKRYFLFRSEVASDQTFTAGYNLAANIYNSVASGSLPGTVRHPDISNVIANNVIDFGVRVWVRGASGLEAIYPDTGDISFASAGADATPTPAQLADPSFVPVQLKDPGTGQVIPDNKRAYPEVIEVFMRILSEEGATQIDNLEKGLISGNWWDIAMANSEVYTRRIEIKAKSL
jgi:prepilin-type N-terminal cleavage/methylation domain-containing protein